MAANDPRRESIAARPLSSPQWGLVWLALALHFAGLAVDTVFHDSEERPFGVFDMLWAHGLSYLGAVAAVVGGRRVARASATRAGCRWVGALTAALGIVQALALALDFVTELAGAQEALGPLVYAFSLVPMILAAFVGAWLCRRTAVATAAPTART